MTLNMIHELLNLSHNLIILHTKSDETLLQMIGNMYHRNLLY